MISIVGFVTDNPLFIGEMSKKPPFEGFFSKLARPCQNIGVTYYFLGETGMRFYIRWLLVVFGVAFGIYFVAGRLTGSRASEGSFFISFVPHDIEIEVQTSKAEITLRVLTENCGKCHQSTRPTADSKALAIFDLDKKNWHASVSDKHLESISRRISKSGISDSDRAAVQDFIACIRKGGCQEND